MKAKYYPASVKVGKKRYRIELVPFIEEIDGDVTRGYCEQEERVIQLLSTQSQLELFSTFIHEALHAIEHEHKVKLRHKTIYAIEGPLAKFLLENFHIYPRR
jgi:hypothetical protein